MKAGYDVAQPTTLVVLVAAHCVVRLVRIMILVEYI